MRRLAVVGILCPLLAASAVAQESAQPFDDALASARAEQAAAEAQTAKLEQAASRARNEADRLHARQAAAAQAINAAEARISAANAQLQLADAYVALHRKRLVAEQEPVSSLLAGLATMAWRPPLLVLADKGGTDELVEVRLLIDSTFPVIRTRTNRLSAQLAEGERLRKAASEARTEISRSHDELTARRQRYAALEQKALQQALASGGHALGTSDVAIAAQEEVERLRGEQSHTQSVRAVAANLAADVPAPPSPFPSQGSAPRPPFAYQLPALAAVTEGLAAVNDAGVRSRGLVLATSRGVQISGPADGTVKFSGPFREYDGILIIDHGGGWMSLLVNIASPLRQGDRVRLGDPIGRALGPLQIELSQNGRRISPALIAGSSPSLSKGGKGG